MPRNPITQPRQQITQPRLPITQPRKPVGFLPTDKVRVVLDTNVILNGLIVKSGKATNPNNEELACLSILEKWEKDEIAVGLNQGLKKEYDEKIEKWIKNGNIDTQDARDLKAMMENARYVRELVDKQGSIFVKPNDKDDMLFDNLSATYLITNDKGVSLGKLKITPPYKEIIKPTDFLARLVP